MAVCLFSLTGLPPLAGFWGKFVLISGALSAGDGSLWLWFVGLSVAAMLNAAVSAGYYLRVVAAMYFRESISVAPARGGNGAALAMAFCALAVLVTGAFPGPWVAAAQRASHAAQVSIVHGSDAGQSADHRDQRSHLPILAASALADSALAEPSGGASASGERTADQKSAEAVGASR
jgi:formate hydrogenlyase subunit 3/multisubunit Na+/H+ antiporter MnhD subunit